MPITEIKIGIGCQRGTHARWQLATNDGTGVSTLADIGASFTFATGGVLTLVIAAPPNGSSVWVRVVDEVSGAVFEQDITGDLAANTQFLSPRLLIMMVPRQQRSLTTAQGGMWRPTTDDTASIRSQVSAPTGKISLVLAGLKLLSLIVLWR
jgi:hypothetical protein